MRQPASCLIYVQLHVVSAAAGSNQINLAIIVYVGGHAALRCDAAVIDDKSIPTVRPAGDQTIPVKAGARAPVPGDYFIVAVAVEIRAAEGVPSVQRIVDHFPVPESRFVGVSGRLRVDRHFVAVPRFDRGKETHAISAPADADLAGAAVRRVSGMAGGKLSKRPMNPGASAFCLEQMDALVRGCEQLIAAVVRMDKMSEGVGEAEVGLIWFTMFSVRSFQESFLRSARGADIDRTDA